MESYPRAAAERAMKVQEVILRAMAKKLTWWQAAEIIGISDRQMGGLPRSEGAHEGAPRLAFGTWDVSYQESGDLHFVTFSCYRRQQHLGSAEARDLFERSLETMRVRYGFFVSGYVVMPEHVHLLLSEPARGTLAKALQALKLSVAVQRSERPFWQARYYDFNVFTGRKLIEKLKYIHRNPVTRGLVGEPEEWAWSSFRH